MVLCVVLNEKKDQKRRVTLEDRTSSHRHVEPVTLQGIATVLRLSLF